jgi:hypothetical protein
MTADTPALAIFDGERPRLLALAYRLLGSAGQTLSTYNEFINVIDANVPDVTVAQLGGGAQSSPRILNLYRPALTVTDVQAAAQQFYTFYRDDFDFLSIAFSIPSYPAIAITSRFATTSPAPDAISIGSICEAPAISRHHGLSDRHALRCRRDGVVLS